MWLVTIIWKIIVAISLLVIPWKERAGFRPVGLFSCTGAVKSFHLAAEYFFKTSAFSVFESYMKQESSSLRGAPQGSSFSLEDVLPTQGSSRDCGLRPGAEPAVLWLLLAEEHGMDLMRENKRGHKPTALLQYCLTSTQCNRNQPLAAGAGQINFFTVHWLAKCFCATEIPARIMCLCLAACSRTWHTCAFWRCFRCSMHSTKELSCPRKHWGNTQQEGFICSHTFTKSDSSICTRSKRWPINLKQKRILWCTSPNVPRHSSGEMTTQLVKVF